MAGRGRFNRREVLRGLGGGAIAAALGGVGFGGSVGRAATGRVIGAQQKLFSKISQPADVSLIKGNDARDNVYKALKHIEDEVVASIGNKKILIKPNFVSTRRELCATHVEAVRGILDFLTPHCKQQITIGESTASRAGTREGFASYGYLRLEKEYNVKLVDLNEQPWVYRYVFGRDHKPMPIRIISTFLDPDTYIISAAKMKTHDRAVTTLALKNVLLGAPVNDYKKNDKRLTHLEYNFSPKAIIHFNMFHLAQEIYPDLGVIDGFVAMEGNGPVGGTPVDARLALASLDPLAMDMLATRLMGFDPGKIMYLTSLAEAGFGQGDLAQVNVLGTPAEQCQYHFKPHPRLVESYGLS
ncbi:MAG: DUF362 domain-containing protein [Phycisphaerales bacterium]|nr:MAG: DUF362 domain-containing protein [Phycisphaerales bacterium]